MSEYTHDFLYGDLTLHGHHFRFVNFVFTFSIKKNYVYINRYLGLAHLFVKFCLARLYENIYHARLFVKFCLARLFVKFCLAHLCLILEILEINSYQI
jgi:hypothetical protein